MISWRKLWWEDIPCEGGHIPLLINIANKRASNGCCADCCDDMCWHRGQCGVVTLAPSSDMHQWCPHHMWSMSMIHVQSLYREQKTSRSSASSTQVCVSLMWTFILGMLESYEDPCFHVTFSALSAGSTSHSMFTVRVYSLPVHSVYNACTPLSRAIHSVVRRPQRGQHQWSSLYERAS